MSNCAIVGINWGDEGKGRQCEALFSQRGQAKQAFAHALQTDISPIDDIRASAQYRRDVLCNLIYQRYLEKEA